MLWSSLTVQRNPHLPSFFGNTPPTQELQREFFLSRCNVVGLPCLKRPQGFLADFPHFREERICMNFVIVISYNQYCCGKTFNLVPNLSMTKTIQRVLPVISSCWFNLTRGETPFQPNCDLYNSLRSPFFGASTELRSDCAQGCCLWLYGLSFHHQIGQRRRWHGRPFFCKKGLRTSTHLEGGSGHRFGANLWRLHTYIYHQFHTFAVCLQVCPCLSLASICCMRTNRPSIF